MGGVTWLYFTTYLEQYITMQYVTLRLRLDTVISVGCITISMSALTECFPRASWPGHSQGSLASWPPFHTVPPTRTALPGQSPVTNVASVRYLVSLLRDTWLIPLSFFCP